MGQPIITVRNVSKRYLLGATLAHDTLRDHIVHGARSLGRLLGGGGSRAEARPAGAEVLWALKDVSFDIAPGEAVGVIGRNGAGKSTLLKILSQITEPTEGEIRIRGRLASLLEVGTGFHPELSGRENIYLNGAILGMTKAEIRRKFDEIVAFAEVEKFLDTPVKRYSSGMYVRLAFAVAAHLEPEILVVDEVLAVGDASFQNKCLGKMEDVAKKEGRTVLFVSHNMAAIQALCTRAILLQGGCLKSQGAVDEQVQGYLAGNKENQSLSVQQTVRLAGSLDLQRFEFSPNPVGSHEPLSFRLELGARDSIRIFDMAILIYSMYGARLAIVDLRSPDGQPFSISPESPLRFSGDIAGLPLIEGDYQVGLYVYGSEYYKDFQNLARITVVQKSAGSDSGVPRPVHHRGLISLKYTQRLIA